MTTTTTHQKVLENDDAACAGNPQPWCDAIDRHDKVCFKASTGLTDYCKQHEDHPETNYNVNVQCDHENEAGVQCNRRVFLMGDRCYQHQGCQLDCCWWIAERMKETIG